MKRAIIILASLFFTSFCQAEITMDWVTVGNAGNANDSTGYGAVSYEYKIGTYEVTAGQYTEFLNAVAATDSHGLYSTKMWSYTDSPQIEQSGNSGSYTYSVASDYANRPASCVSWYDTLRFSNWLHNGQPTGGQTTATTEDGAYDMSLGSSVTRKAGAQVWLPSEDEWYKAAYHKNDGITGNYFDYPTSSDSVPGRDMDGIPHPFIVESLARFADLPAEERDKVRFFHLNHSNPLLVPGTPARERVHAAGMHVANDGEVHDL